MRRYAVPCQPVNQELHFGVSDISSSEWSHGVGVVQCCVHPSFMLPAALLGLKRNRYATAYIPVRRSICSLSVQEWLVVFRQILTTNEKK